MHLSATDNNVCLLGPGGCDNGFTDVHTITPDAKILSQLKCAHTLTRTNIHKQAHTNTNRHTHALYSNKYLRLLLE